MDAVRPLLFLGTDRKKGSDSRVRVVPAFCQLSRLHNSAERGLTGGAPTEEKQIKKAHKMN